MTDFIAVYRGQTVADAQIVATTADPGVVEGVLEQLFGRRILPGEPVDSGRPPLAVIRGGKKDD